MVLIIRPNQLQALGEALCRSRRDEMVAQIVSQLRHEASELMERYTLSEQVEIVREVVDAAIGLGIRDAGHLLNWTYIRFLMNSPFYKADQFADILNHPFLHPNAKGRHLVLAFFAIQRIQREAA